MWNLRMAVAVLLSSPLYGDGNPEPFGLEEVGPVVQANAPVDAAHQAYQDFRATILNYLDDPNNQSNSGSTPFFDPVAGTFMGGTLVDDNRIVLPIAAHLRMYFVRETAGFSNSLGFVKSENTDLFDPVNHNSLIFPLIAADGDGVADQDLIGGPGFFNSGITASLPEAPVLRELFNPVDDFVDLGSFNEGQEIEFYLIPDGADVASDATLATAKPWWNPNDAFDADAPVWWSDDTKNIDSNDGDTDGVRHLRVSSFSQAQTTYYLMAWEDTPFPENLGDPVDFNDVVTVLQVMQVPEPSFYLTLTVFLCVAMLTKKHRKVKRRRI